MSTAPKAPRKAAAKPAAAKPAAKPATDKQPSAAEGLAVSLEPILAAMRKRLPKARQAEGEAFINAFYRRMSDDELPRHSADGWAALAVDFLDFARPRKPGTALVRRCDPTIKSHGWDCQARVL